MAEVEKSNEPIASAFRQQNLTAWQPILTPVWVILTFLVIGVIFVPVGIVLKGQADGVYEQVIFYDAPSPDVPGCDISQPNQGYQAIQQNASLNCIVNFTFTKDIPITTPVHLYYQLTNFYQNHRRYVKSRDDAQVNGKFVAKATLQTSCDPNGSVISLDSGLIYAPCGLIATSFFNDAFFLTPGQDNAITLDETKIAWKSDLANKFTNPTNPPGSTPDKQPLNNWSTYQYLWQTYDQMSCYLTGQIPSAATRTECTTWAQLVGPGTYGQGCAKCDAFSTPRYEGGIPPPGGANFDPTPGIPGNATSLYGFRDEHFVVWMRTAGLPQFRKLYAVLTPPSGGFKKGMKISFEIVPNFEVASFKATKALVLSTSTPTGGRSDVLGIAYLAVGTICLALAIAFFMKHTISPRKLGDPNGLGDKQ